MKRIVMTAIFSSLLAACRTSTPITTVEHVDLKRFMGDWHVIANIPTILEQDAYNAVESYRLDDDGTIDTTFTFNKGASNGPQKRYNPRGFVLDQRSNAVWGMRFIWPVKADYRILFISDDYSRTVVGREARDYVWIMSRTPTLNDAEYGRLLALVEREGYDLKKIRKVPQLQEARQ